MEDGNIQNEYAEVMMDYISFLKSEIKQKNYEIQEKGKIINILLSNNDKPVNNNIETRSDESVTSCNVVNSTHSIPQDNSANEYNYNTSQHSTILPDNVCNYGSNQHSARPTNDRLSEKKDRLTYQSYEEDDVINFSEPSNKFRFVTERRKANKNRASKNPPNFESLNPFNSLQLRDNYEVENGDVTAVETSDDEDDDEVVRNHERSKLVGTNCTRNGNQTGKSVNSNFFVNNNPENDVQSYNRKRIVPGIKSYAEVAHHSKQICIFGDSIPQRLRMRDFNNKLDNCHAFKKIFPGGTVKELRHYITETLSDNDLDGIVINVGLNSLHNGKYRPQQTEDEIFSMIIEMVNLCEDNGVSEIYISGLTYKKGYGKEISVINELIIANANLAGYTYFDNTNLTRQHYWKDNLHLNENGLDVLSDNFINALNYSR